MGKFSIHIDCCQFHYTLSFRLVCCSWQTHLVFWNDCAHGCYGRVAEYVILSLSIKTTLKLIDLLQIQTYR